MSDPSLPAPQDVVPPAQVPTQVPAQVPTPVHAPADLGGIELKTSFFPLAFLLFLFPAKAVIDGHSELAHGWGTKVYPVPAGRHTVRVWCPYFGMMKMGDGEHTVDVVPGQVTAIEWKSPWLVFLQGSFVALGSRGLTQGDLQNGASTVGTVAAPPAPALAPAAVPAAVSTVAAGWHPDPQGQAALRYWDGQQWTEHTAAAEAAPA